MTTNERNTAALEWKPNRNASPNRTGLPRLWQAIVKSLQILDDGVDQSNPMCHRSRLISSVCVLPQNDSTTSSVLTEQVDEQVITRFAPPGAYDRGRTTRHEKNLPIAALSVE